MPTQSRYIYSDDEMLPLSGIQHYMFCPRQWALIHVEQLWNDNRLTMEGSLLHENVDNPFVRETNGSDVVTLRSVRLASPNLGLSGITDAVELRPLVGAPKKKSGLLKSRLFTAIPVEYKRGRRKTSDCDRVQVAAQAMILEEMLGVGIDTAALFYWEERHREYVDIDEQLRCCVVELSEQMHRIVRLGTTPSARKIAGCRSCSLRDLCMPSIADKNVKRYLTANFDETTA